MKETLVGRCFRMNHLEYQRKERQGGAEAL